MRRLICLTAAVTMLLAPAAAQADGGAAVIHDCSDHGRITGHYTQKQYAQALAELPADINEYSDCEALIRRAQLAAAGGHSGGGGGASPSNALSTANRSERAALRAAVQAGSHPFDIGGRLVRPGVVAVRSSVFNALPTPLLIALAALLAAALGAAGHRVWTIVRARR
jgi:hypothetical protein